jgi:hypothetical protein
MLTATGSALPAAAGSLGLARPPRPAPGRFSCAGPGPDRRDLRTQAGTRAARDSCATTSAQESLVRHKSSTRLAAAVLHATGHGAARHWSHHWSRHWSRRGTSLVTARHATGHGAARHWSRRGTPLVTARHATGHGAARHSSMSGLRLHRRPHSGVGAAAGYGDAVWRIEYGMATMAERAPTLAAGYGDAVWRSIYGGTY